MKLWNIVKKQSIAVWIVTIFLLTILPINFMLISGTQNYIQSLEALTVGSGQSYIDLYMSEIDNAAQMADSFLFSAEQTDTNFITVLRDRQDDHYMLSLAAVVREFDNHLSTNLLSGAYFLISPQMNEPIMIGSGCTSNEKRMIREFFVENRDLWSNRLWQYITIEEQNYLLHFYQQDEVYYGSVICLEPILEEMINNLSLEYLDLDFVLKSQPKTEPQNAFILRADSAKTELAVEMYLDQKAVYRNLPLIRRIGVAFSFVCILVLPVLLFVFHFLLVRPLKRIAHALNHLEQGQQEYRLTGSFSGRELIEISRSFNRMADQIQHLKIESYEEELEKNRVMLRNMQLQVRPHFLLNIFHLIFSMAQTGSFTGIQKMTLYLSAYFRHMFTEDNLHPLSVELELVKGYLGVLEVQYPDCFEALFEVDERLLAVPVPNLVLHNLLENIAKYTISVGIFITISIRGYLREGTLYLEVEDDGAGIEESVLREIRAGNPVDKKDGRHIGLYNAGKRLKLFCSEEVRMEVESEVGSGTRVRILFPESYYRPWMQENGDE